MSKHTPSPWYAYGATIFSGHDKERQAVATVAISSLNGAYSIANRRLIVAAPELLDACIAAEGKFLEYAALHAKKEPTEENLQKTERNMEMATMLRVAIDKALEEEDAP